MSGGEWDLALDIPLQHTSAYAESLGYPQRLLVFDYGPEGRFCSLTSSVF